MASGSSGACLRPFTAITPTAMNVCDLSCLGFPDLAVFANLRHRLLSVDLPQDVLLVGLQRHRRQLVGPLQDRIHRHEMVADRSGPADAANPFYRQGLHLQIDGDLLAARAIAFLELEGAFLPCEETPHDL